MLPLHKKTYLESTQRVAGRGRKETAERVPGSECLERLIGSANADDGFCAEKAELAVRIDATSNIHITLMLACRDASGDARRLARYQTHNSQLDSIQLRAR